MEEEKEGETGGGIERRKRRKKREKGKKRGAEEVEDGRERKEGAGKWRKREERKG